MNHWQVPYEAGVLRALGWKAGRLAAKAQVETVGTPHRAAPGAGPQQLCVAMAWTWCPCASRPSTRKAARIRSRATWCSSASRAARSLASAMATQQHRTREGRSPQPLPWSGSGHRAQQRRRHRRVETHDQHGRPAKRRREPRPHPAAAPASKPPVPACVGAAVVAARRCKPRRRTRNSNPTAGHELLAGLPGRLFAAPCRLRRLCALRHQPHALLRIRREGGWVEAPSVTGRCEVYSTACCSAARPRSLHRPLRLRLPPGEGSGGWRLSSRWMRARRWAWGAW